MAARIGTFIREHWAIGIVAIAALLMRLPHLTRENVWMDEFYAIKAATMFPELIRTGELIQLVGVVPGFYFLLLRAWMFLLGNSLFAMRMLSALFGVAGVYAVYLLGAKLRNRATGLIAAFLLSIHAGHFFHSQDIRHYTLFLFLTVLLFLLFDRYRSSRQPRVLGALLLTEYVLANTHFFGIFVVLVMHLLHAERPAEAEWKKWNRYHAWGLVVLGLTFTLYGGLSIDDLRNQISAIEGKSWLALFREIAQWLAYGGDEFAERYIHIPELSQRGAAPLMTVTMILGAWCWQRERRETVSTVLLWLLAPVGALLLLSELYRPVILQRHIFNLTPAYVLLVAAGVDWLWRKQKLPGMLLLGAIVTVMLPALWAQTTQVKRFPLQAAAQAVRQLHEQGDVLMVLPAYCRAHFAYFLNPTYALRRMYLYDPKTKRRPPVRMETTPYISSYTGEGDARFWFFLDDELFEPFEDASVSGKDKPVYIMAKPEGLLRFFTYYPVSMYPERVIVVTNSWADMRGRDSGLIHDRILQRHYRLIHSQAWNVRDVELMIFERTREAVFLPGNAREPARLRERH